MGIMLGLNRDYYYYGIILGLHSPSSRDPLKREALLLETPHAGVQVGLS